ncbi:MAG: hypothetical protein U0Y82_05845 [Thermoleophilia bacterium]
MSLMMLGAMCAMCLCAVAAGDAVTPAPSLHVAPNPAMVGAAVTARGVVAAGAACPRVRLTVARQAGGAAAVVRVRAPRAGAYAITFRAPAVALPTDPAAVATRLVVRVWCVGARSPRAVTRARGLVLRITRE